MKCDICGKELANSEELKMHQEHEHPMEDPRDDELEAPDQMDAEPARPEPVIRPGR